MRLLSVHVLAAFLMLLFSISIGFADGNATTDFKGAVKVEDYEMKAQRIIDIAVARENKLRTRRRELFFKMSKTYGLLNKAPQKQDIESETQRLLYELAGNLSTIPLVQLQNTTLRRIVQLQSKLQLNGLQKKDLLAAREMLHRMQTFITQPLVCRLNHTEDCSKIVSMPEISLHTLRLRRIENLDYYWQKWRQAINEHNNAKSSFINYVRFWRMAGAYNGHVTPSRTWYLLYETENFQRELEEVVLELMPLYKELHAYLRHSTRLTYGGHITDDDDGGIPAPVLEQFINQAWFDRTAFHVPYPDHHLPAVQTRLKEVHQTASEMAKSAATSFTSMGLYSLSQSFFENYVRLISGDEAGHDCKASVYYLPPNVAMRYCNQVDYKKHMQMHGYMAELFYNMYKNETPIFLDHEPCPGFSSALGEAAVVASGAPRHLHRLHILDNSSLSNEQAMNRIFRMGVHTLLAIPQYFVNEKFLVDVMDARISLQDFNCAYWRLQHKYAGVVPLSQRNEETFDADFKFYRGLNSEKSSVIKFISEVLGYQFHLAFCLASNQYKPNDPEYPLHNCDFYGNANVGRIIKEMMRLGATKHWRDAMEIATGERKLSAKGLLEYFAPLHQWLKAKNEELNLDVGWDADIKCSSD